MIKSLVFNKRFFFILIIWLLLVIPLSHTSLYFIFNKVVLDNELEKLNLKSEQVTETIRAYTENMDEDRLTELFSVLVPKNGMIQVIDKEQEPVITVVRQLNLVSIEEPYFTEESTNKLRTIEGIRYAITNTPIIWNDGEVVTLKMVENLESTQKNMEILKPILTVISLTLIISIVPIIFLAKKNLINQSSRPFP